MLCTCARTLAPAPSRVIAVAIQVAMILLCSTRCNCRLPQCYIVSAGTLASRVHTSRGSIAAAEAPIAGPYLVLIHLQCVNPSAGSLEQPGLSELHHRRPRVSSAKQARDASENRLPRQQHGNGAGIPGGGGAWTAYTHRPECGLAGAACGSHRPCLRPSNGQVFLSVSCCCQRASRRASVHAGCYLVASMPLGWVCEPVFGA